MILGCMGSDLPRSINLRDVWTRSVLYTSEIYRLVQFYKSPRCIGSLNPIDPRCMNSLGSINLRCMDSLSSIHL